MPIFVSIPVIVLASVNTFRTEWENGCQTFRSERVKFGVSLGLGLQLGLVRVRVWVVVRVMVMAKVRVNTVNGDSAFTSFICEMV